MSSRSNNELLKDYLDKENLPYKTVEYDGKEIIKIELSKYTKEQRDNLYKDI